MGAGSSAPYTREPTQHGVAPKNSYAGQPETAFDDLAVRDDVVCSEDLPRIRTCDLRGKLSAECARAAVACLHARGFVVLKMTEAEHAATRQLYDTMAQFFDRPVAEKERLAPPARVDNSRTQFSGYSRIRFDNRDNRRAPEDRDVFQIRPGENTPVPWPADSPLADHSMAVYHSMWTIAESLVEALARESGHDASHLLRCCAPSAGVSDDVATRSSKSDTSNLCLFRYRDEYGYTDRQVCMVHQDYGFVTIVPKSTSPGLEVLDIGTQSFVPIEPLLEDDECIAYIGVAMQHALRSRVRALVHRVVRAPDAERFSMPFELKPGMDEPLPVLPLDAAALFDTRYKPPARRPGDLFTLYEDPDEACPGENGINGAKCRGGEEGASSAEQLVASGGADSPPITFRRLEMRLQWQRTMRAVERADAGPVLAEACR